MGSTTTTRTWKDSDVDLGVIKNQTIAVLGYGIQGDAQANNLKDSGLDVVVGLKKGGKSWDKAVSDGHKVMSVSEATKKADIVHILIPDMVQEQIFKEEIVSNLDEGNALSFSHGAAVHWKWIDPPGNVDVIMVAPKGPGSKVRDTFVEGFGTPSIIAVQQDYTKKAWQRVLALAKGIGSTRPGVIETSFQEEVETDWFGEQADLCGGCASMITNAFETLTEAGYRPEIAYFEVLHELKLIVDLIQRYGIAGMYRRVSETARYGGLTRGPIVMDSTVKNNMKKVLDMIQNGIFNEEWVDDYQKNGKTAFERYMGDLEAHQIEKVGKKMRQMMWPNSTE